MSGQHGQTMLCLLLSEGRGAVNINENPLDYRFIAKDVQEFNFMGRQSQVTSSFGDEK